MVVGNDRAADFLRLQAQKRILELDNDLEEIDKRISVNMKSVEFDQFYYDELTHEREALSDFLGDML